MVSIIRGKSSLGKSLNCDDQSYNLNSNPIIGKSSNNNNNNNNNKRALLCGVSYNKSKHKLKGPLNDVNNMRDLLIHTFNFNKECIRVLTEEEPSKKYAPTKVNIMESLEWLVKDCKNGDSLVFYFSGHGLRQPEFDGKEDDGFDETICPVDFAENGMIRDNELYSTIVKPLRKGTKLHAIIDACHSGSVLDLPYVFDINRKTWENSEATITNNEIEGLAICISACKDNELAADTSAFTGKTMNGALTYALIDMVKKNSKSGMTILTYGDLLEGMNELIDGVNPQGCKSRKGKCIAIANRRSKILRTLFQSKIIPKPLLSSSEEFAVDAMPFSL